MYFGVKKINLVQDPKYLLITLKMVTNFRNLS